MARYLVPVARFFLVLCIRLRKLIVLKCLDRQQIFAIHSPWINKNLEEIMQFSLAATKNLHLLCFVFIFVTIYILYTFDIYIPICKCDDIKMFCIFLVLKCEWKLKIIKLLGRKDKWKKWRAQWRFGKQHGLVSQLLVCWSQKKCSSRIQFGSRKNVL